MSEPRLTVDTINSDQLDALQDRVEFYEAALARMRDRAEVATVRATKAERAANLLADAHRRAEQAEAAIERARKLATRWTAAGPPPIGTPMSRWWDKRLIELHDAILTESKEPTT